MYTKNKVNKINIKLKYSHNLYFDYQMMIFET